MHLRRTVSWVPHVIKFTTNDRAQCLFSLGMAHNTLAWLNISAYRHLVRQTMHAMDCRRASLCAWHERHIEPQNRSGCAQDSL